MKKRTSTNSSFFSRSLSLAKLTLSVGAETALHAASGLLQDKDTQLAKGKAVLEKNIKRVTNEARYLRGAFAKAGQVLSTIGESFFPPEINNILKTLQSEVEPLPFDDIRSILIERLGEEKFNQLDIDPVPVGSASLGQVHRALVKSTQEMVAVKLLYPGIEQAIDSDLKIIRLMLQSAKLIPREVSAENINGIFEEARSVLHQEVDYQQELLLLKKYRNFIGNDSRYIVPEPKEHFCGKGVITSSYVEGVRVDSPAVRELTLDRRNRLASNFIDLFLCELIDWNLVQTDPHFGNYLVRLDPSGNDQWVVLDFGAFRTFSEKFRSAYLTVLRGVLTNQPDTIVEGGQLLGLIEPGDPQEMKNLFVDLAFEAGEAFLFAPPNTYNFGTTDLPKRMAKRAPSVIYQLKMRLPPREMLSMDRRLGGTFFHLVNLKAELGLKTVVQAKLGLGHLS